MKGFDQKPLFSGWATARLAQMWQIPPTSAAIGSPHV
jgi:hypothetical protein